MFHLRLPRFQKLVLSFLLSASFAGCAGTDFTNLFAGEQTKLQQLDMQVRSFNQALYWGSLEEASSFVEPSSTAQFYQQYAKLKRSQRLVDSQVENVILAPTGDSAEVVVAVRYYKVPSYLIRARTEHQHWVFKRYAGGWRFQRSEFSNDAVVDQSKEG